MGWKRWTYLLITAFAKFESVEFIPRILKLLFIQQKPRSLNVWTYGLGLSSV